MAYQNEIDLVFLEMIVIELLHFIAKKLGSAGKKSGSRPTSKEGAKDKGRRGSKAGSKSPDKKSAKGTKSIT